MCLPSVSKLALGRPRSPRRQSELLILAEAVPERLSSCWNLPEGWKGGNVRGTQPRGQSTGGHPVAGGFRRANGHRSIRTNSTGWQSVVRENTPRGRGLRRTAERAGRVDGSPTRSYRQGAKAPECNRQAWYQDRCSGRRAATPHTDPCARASRTERTGGRRRR